MLIIVTQIAGKGISGDSGPLGTTETLALILCKFPESKGTLTPSHFLF